MSYTNMVMPNSFAGSVARVFVREILERPYDREWSIQGFGMLRTYLDEDKVWRLNIWDSRLGVKDVSTIHDHPWDFQSLVVSGVFTNRRYRPALPHETGARAYRHMRIKTGPGGGPAGDIARTYLAPQPDEVYHAGDIYRQQAEEIHESLYLDGTVTLNARIRRADPDHANVFWADGDWIDAEPREATHHEIDLAVQSAARMF